MHYFYATNTPLVTIITTGVLAIPHGIEPRFMTSKAIVLPLDDRVLLVLSVGNDPTFLALQASTLTISVKIAFGIYVFVGISTTPACTFLWQFAHSTTHFATSASTLLRLFLLDTSVDTLSSLSSLVW